MKTIPATNCYRTFVAAAVAEGGVVMPRAVSIAFGCGTTPAGPEDTKVEDEFLRKPLSTTVPDRMILHLTAELLGVEVGDNTITEIGIYADNGLLMARRVFAPKTLDADSRLLFELDLMF